MSCVLAVLALREVALLLEPMTSLSAMQRNNNENSKQIFPEKKLLGQSLNFHILSVSDLYIPTIDLPILLQEICGPILGICKPLTDT